MCLSRDVSVRARDARQITVVSREPGVPGERGQLTLTGSNTESIAVRVATSRPIVIDGSVRHVVNLTLVVERVQDAS